jgi:heat shock protein HslJ
MRCAHLGQLVRRKKSRAHPVSRLFATKGHSVFAVPKVSEKNWHFSGYKKVIILALKLKMGPAVRIFEVPQSSVMKLNFAILFLVFLNPGFKAQPLTGHAWKLAGINDRLNNIRQDIDTNYHVTIVMDTDSTYSGSACNHFRGTYRIPGPGAVVFSRPAGSKKYCTGPPGNIEKNLYGLLTRVNRFVVKQNRLVLFTEDQHELVFIR